MSAPTDPRSLLAMAAPEAAARASGVEPRTLELLEGELGLRFPAGYREFLRTMGQDTGGFAAMDPTHVTSLGELLAELPGPDERTARYWRVSIERQLVKAFTVDFYLDLSTSDGDDAELVTFSCPPDDPAEEGDRVGLTFSEQLRHRLFQQYVAVRPETACWLYAPRVPPGELAAVRQRLHAALAAEALGPFAPAPGRLALYRGAGHAVSVRWFDELGGLGVGLEAPTLAQSLLLAEKLRDRMPEDTQMLPPPQARR